MSNKTLLIVGIVGAVGLYIYLHHKSVGAGFQNQINGLKQDINNPGWDGVTPFNPNILQDSNNQTPNFNSTLYPSIYG